ncbi:hypothetical protein FBQ85_22720 [Cytophagia bacterium CHB2]|nr:hypothetical protein [Cytophagia bacterium CHB2]
MPADLRDKRILITAPLDSSERIAGLVRQRGGIPVIAPLIKRVPLPGSEALQNKLRALSSYRWIVFTSAGAVESALGTGSGLRHDDLRVTEGEKPWTMCASHRPVQWRKGRSCPSRQAGASCC